MMFRIKMKTIILFYKYIYIPSPEAILKWQKKLCAELGLKGRVLLAHEGINATLGGSQESINAYKETMNAHVLFGDIDFKESLGSDDHFPRLRIVVRPEIVNTGLPADVAPASQAGKHLEPTQAHQLMEEKPDNLVIIDCRNPYESAIGTVPGAWRPDVPHFRDFPAYIDKKLEELKDKQVLMYCTGGVRCERASAYLKAKNVAQEVYHIKGGIHRYVEQFPNGFFRGKNYVFDGRTAMKITDDILASCSICNVPADEYNNCLRAACNRHYISCADCLVAYNYTCSYNCNDLIVNHNAIKRPHPKISPTYHDNSNKLP
jgi:predicted sulfurtransferase